jgi:hypothetical protein
VCDQWHASRVYNLLPVTMVRFVQTLKAHHGHASRVSNLLPVAMVRFVQTLKAHHGHASRVSNLLPVDSVISVGTHNKGTTCSWPLRNEQIRQHSMHSSRRTRSRTTRPKNTRSPARSGSPLSVMTCAPVRHGALLSLATNPP